MSTREYFEGVIDDVVSMLAVDARIEDTPELNRAVRECIDAEFGSFDDFVVRADALAVHQARKILGPAFLAATGLLREEPLPTIPAHVDYEIWVRDYAVEIGSESFDAAPVLLLMEPETVFKLEAGDYDYAGDELFFAAARFGLVSDHDGPFSCCIDDQDALDAFRAKYIAARKERTS